MVFDPGITGRSVDELCLVREFLNAINRGEKDYPVIIPGNVVVRGKVFKLDRVLFDSGALSSSYIDLGLVNKFRDLWSNNIYQVDGVVRLGDQKTTLPVNERARLELSFIRPEIMKTRAKVDMIVMDMPGMDIILGLPDILDHFLELFIDLLISARPGFQHTTNILMNVDDPTLISPWREPLLEIAPEEEETEVPCSFSGPLYYLSKPYDEVLSDYRALFDSHVSKDWIEKSNIIDILNSDAAIRVFVPSDWHGVSGFEPVEFKWLPDMPKEHRPPYRPINPKIFEATKAEFARMCKYMYTDSDSPIAVPLVVAPKATAPFIRICGDYVWVNQYVIAGHYYIPHVMHELEKAAGFSYFIDLDLTNSFHQIPLGEETSSRLSVTTPWGLKRPIYLPEGVAPASGILQKMVMSVFSDFSDWTVALFDNLLVLCHDLKDGIEKFKKIIQRCDERGVVLKFSKSWIGFQEVKFFGYRVTPGKYEMDADRKQSVLDAPMPTTSKGMQRFLGVAVFFNEFIPNYSDVTAKLYEMINPNFSWNRENWKCDYAKEYEDAKLALANSTAKHFPNYEWDWILRTDASQNGVGGVLLQVDPTDPDKPKYLPIGFKSKKFSGAATRWDTHKQEAYAIYFCVKAFAYYLYAKKFIIETDHRNLLWMESSDALIVIRWRIFLQSFNFLLRDIKGKENIVADWQSRLYMIEVNSEEVLANVEDPSRAEHYFSQVHGGRMLHPGVRETMKRLNLYFPGHGIPERVVREMVSACPRCQKDRLVVASDIKPIVRHLIPETHRTRVGIDALTISPEDKNGNKLAVVIVEQKTKHTAIYPAKSYDQLTAAQSIFRYMCSFRLHDEIISDPGSMFMSDAVAQLNAWLGIRHKVSLVDVHESNGVERTNAEILRHLRSLCNDERIRKHWSEPHVICLIEYALNSRVHSESSHSALELKFGTEDAKYFKLPDELSPGSISNEWLKSLNENLRVIRDINVQFQEELIKEQLKDNPEPDKINKYQKGDLVLYDILHDPCRRRPEKLDSRYKGPFEVIQQVKDEVECRHVCLMHIAWLLVERLKLFVGTKEEAFQIAMEDADQYVVQQILAWRGDPSTRTTMEFEVQFADGDVVWKPYDRDLADCSAFKDFVRVHTELLLLQYTVEQGFREAKAINSEPIIEVNPGDVVFLDIRYLNTGIYDAQVLLDDKWHRRYVVRLEYKRWAGNQRKKIDGHVLLFDLTYMFNRLFVLTWGNHRVLTDDMIEVTMPFLSQHQDILELLPDRQSKDRVRRALNL